MNILNFNEISEIANRVLAITQEDYPDLFIFFDTLSRSGLRPSELLNLDNFNYINNNHIEFIPKKNNNVRIFNDNNFNPYILKLIAQDLPLTYNFSTRYLARQFNKYAGLSLFVNKKNISTYLFRHIYIKNLHQHALTALEIKLKLGHTNISTTYSYINSIIYT